MTWCPAAGKNAPYGVLFSIQLFYAFLFTYWSLYCKTVTDIWVFHRGSKFSGARSLDPLEFDTKTSLEYGGGGSRGLSEGVLVTPKPSTFLSHSFARENACMNPVGRYPAYRDTVRRKILP